MITIDSKNKSIHDFVCFWLKICRQLYKCRIKMEPFRLKYKMEVYNLKIKTNWSFSTE